MKNNISINKISKEDLEEMVAKSSTYMEIIRALGYNVKGGRVYEYLKNRLKEFGIDTSHFKGKAHGTSKTQKYSMDEILVKNSTYNNLFSLKNRLIKEGLKEYKCENPECGISEWHGKPITLQLHHINGINNDNRLENLQLLCPNCHSQTENFCSKNKY